MMGQMTGQMMGQMMGQGPQAARAATQMLAGPPLRYILTPLKPVFACVLQSDQPSIYLSRAEPTTLVSFNDYLQKRVMDCPSTACYLGLVCVMV